jgi:hypothetical protein
MPTEAQREALLVEAHRAIEEAATRAAEMIAGVRPLEELAYPPNGGLTGAEESALSDGATGPDAVAPLRKIIADAAAAPLFKVFALIDGVADPEDWDGDWLPMQLSEIEEGDVEPEMLHDAFFDAYWTWVGQRPDEAWRLDTTDESSDQD